VKTGSQDFIDKMKEERDKLKNLENFSYDEDGIDRGNSIRNKAKYLVEILSDSFKLKDEKKEMKLVDDVKLEQITDSINQALALISRYENGFSQNSFSDWLKQEIFNCGFDLLISYDDVDGNIEFNIFGKVLNLSLVLHISDKEELVSCSLNYKDESYVIPHVEKLINERKLEQLSHLLSMSARLDFIEISNQHEDNQQKSFQNFIKSYGFSQNLEFSLGGYQIPFIDDYNLILTMDVFENQSIHMLVLDPPIVFPYSRLNELMELCSFRLSLDLSLTSTFSRILNLPSEIIRQVDDSGFRLVLNDEDLPSILIARIPLFNIENFENIVDYLKRSTRWFNIIKETFCQTEDIESNLTVDIQPVDSFSLVLSYLQNDCPRRIVVAIQPDCSLITNNPETNNMLASENSFKCIISSLNK